MKSILKLKAFQIHLFFANKFLPKITVCLERDCRMIPPFRFCIYNEISTFPTLASGASIARGRPPPNGGAHLVPSLRSRRDRIGQKPEPTIRRGITCRRAGACSRRFLYSQYVYRRGAFHMLPKKKGRIWNPPIRYYGNIFVSSAGACPRPTL